MIEDKNRLPSGDIRGDIQPVLSQILQELEGSLSGISDKSVDELVDAILQAENIFVSGAGRSGLAARGFAMRLMQMGFHVHVVGETTTPNLASGDLLLIASGSGRTEGQVVTARMAKALGAPLALLTADKSSPLGKLADIVLEIPTPLSTNQTHRESASIQPLGTLFEQSLFLTLDALVLLLMGKTATTPDVMFQKHANLE